jgi:salicylate hydroxylase
MAEAGIRPLSTGKYFRDPLDSWSSGRVTLLGDAAHPAGSPAAGQGAAMAIEDAVTLAICLRHHGSTHIAAGLAEYEQRRIARTISMFIQARSLNSMLYEEDPVRIRGRNNRLRGMERMDPESVVLWGPLHGFDAIAEARTPLEKLRRDTDEPLREREPARRAARVWRDALAVEDRVGGWVSERRGYERVLGQATPVPASAQRADYDGVSVIDVPGGDGPTLVYIHGGGFELGSALSYAGVAARVAAAIGGRAIVPDYRLAPEYPAPAAIDDVMATVRWLTRRSPNGYVLCGDEAGAGLAVAAAMRLRDEGTALPLAIYCFSPLIDLSLSSPSIDANPGKDPWHTRQILTWRASGFLAGEIPGASPWPPQRADLIGLPPAIIWAGDDEALRDDAVALAHGMQEAELVLVRDSVTAFVLFDYLPESADALALLKRHLTELLKRERQDN